MNKDNHNNEFEVRDLRNKEVFLVDDLYLNGWAQKCGIYATGVYFVLCRHANAATQSCFPSISLISKKLNISQAQTKRALRILECFNIIRTERTSGRVNVYYLLDKKQWNDTQLSQTPVSNRHDTQLSQILAPVSGRAPNVSNRRYQKNDTSSNSAFGVLSYLNDKTGKKYRNAKHIEARLKAGATVEDCKRVIDTKCNDPFFIAAPKHLNPETLFRPSNFDRYLNESPDQPPRTPPKGSTCPRCKAQIPPQDRTPDGCIHCENSREARAC